MVAVFEPLLMMIPEGSMPAPLLSAESGVVAVICGSRVVPVRVPPAATVPPIPRSAAVVPLWVSAIVRLCVASPLTTSEPPESETVAVDPAAARPLFRRLTTSLTVAALERSIDVLVAPSVTVTGPAATPLSCAPLRSESRVLAVNEGVRF